MIDSLVPIVERAIRDHPELQDPSFAHYLARCRYRGWTDVDTTRAINRILRDVNPDSAEPIQVSYSWTNKWRKRLVREQPKYYVTPPL